MNEVKITKENYKAYVELYKYYLNIDFPSEKAFYTWLISNFAWLSIALIINIISPVISTTLIIGGVGVIQLSLFSNIMINRKKNKDKLRKKYPFIDYNIKEKQLEELLMRNNLLQYNPTTNTHYLNENGYIDDLQEKLIKTKKMSIDEIIVAYKKQDILSNNEENIKQKVKTLGSK